MPTLLIMKGEALDQCVPLPGAAGRLVLGRGRSNDVVLEDHGMLVSRRHAEVRAGADGYSIVDLASANGVWRCGTRVGAATLEAIEPVVIGPYCLLLGEAALESPIAAPPSATGRDETSATPDWSSPGSFAAVLIGAGILIGLIGGGLATWLLLSLWARPSAALAPRRGALTALVIVVPATSVRAPETCWPASRARHEEPA